jgi:uncharacterized GH25 family protein
MYKRMIALAAVICSLATTANAHSLWINAFESRTHPPPHAMISLGWGHALPMDDILNSPNGRIAIENFQLVDPAQRKTELIKPDPKLGEPALTTDNFDLYLADLAAQKVAFREESAAGVYQLSAVSKAAFYTQYVDKKGRTRMQLKPKDQLDDVETVLMSVKYQAFAKAYLTKGAWQPPTSLGHALEISPLTDLSQLQVGDLVAVDVRFHGEPLTASAAHMDYITARSSSFGQGDGFALISYLSDGKAQFRIQCAGQWIIGVYHRENVSAEGPLKNLAGKADQVYHSASLSFSVK